jgi:hypothetical protein
VKWFLVIPLAIAAAFAVMGAGIRRGGWAIQPADVIAAFAIVVLAAEIALAPAFVVRKIDQAVATRAALVGTILHLLVSVVLAAAVLLAKIVPANGAFVYWLLPGYLLSLCLVAMVLTAWIRAAPQVTPRVAAGVK